MAALHRFDRPNGGEDNTSFAYSLLCEASHPNHRGTQLFVHTEEVDSSGEYGWRVTYSATESVPPLLTEKLVETLIFSMSNGYGATELLRNMHLRDSDTGVIALGVSPDVGERIFFDILRKSVPSKKRSARQAKGRNRQREPKPKAKAKRKTKRLT
jgi:hypothetical protein